MRITTFIGTKYLLDLGDSNSIRLYPKSFKSLFSFVMSINIYFLGFEGLRNIMHILRFWEFFLIAAILQYLHVSIFVIMDFSSFDVVFPYSGVILKYVCFFVSSLFPCCLLFLFFFDSMNIYMII